MVDLLLVDPTNDTSLRGQYKDFGDFVATQKAEGLAAANTPHIGLGYLLAVAHANNISGHVINMVIDGYSINDLLDYIKKYRPLVVGFTAFTVQIKTAAYMAGLIKEQFPSIVTCLGGAHATALPVETFREFPNVFDCVIPGEGEAILPTLFDNLNSLSNIPGVFTADTSVADGIPWHNRQAQTDLFARVTDLNDIPFPRWELFPLEKYAGNMQQKDHRHELPMSTSRGCMYTCNFCSRNFGRRRIYRSVDSVIDEISRNHTNFGADTIDFLDETFVASKKFSEKLFLAMIKNGLNKKIQFGCETTVHLDDPAFYKLMKEAGCTNIFFGFESANKDMLKRTGKGVKNKEQIKKAVDAAVSAGIVTTGSFIFGLPGETRETAQEIVDFSAEIHNKVYSITFPIAVPFPGTSLRDMAKKNEYGLRILTNDWDHYGKQYPGVMESEALSIDELREFQKIAYQVNPKKELKNFIHQLTQQA